MNANDAQMVVCNAEWNSTDPSRIRIGICTIYSEKLNSPSHEKPLTCNELRMGLSSAWNRYTANASAQNWNARYCPNLNAPQPINAITTATIFSVIDPFGIFCASGAAFASAIHAPSVHENQYEVNNTISWRSNTNAEITLTIPTQASTAFMPIRRRKAISNGYTR